MGKLSRDKGARVEREIVKLHRAIGVFAERVPLSGGTGYQGNGEDVDVYPNGQDYAPLICQVKGLNGPRGTKGITDALGEADALFLRFDAEPGQRVRPPIVVMPWATYEALLLRQKKP
jgi:hypothetical protein